MKLTNYELTKLKQEADRRGMGQSELLRSLIAKFPEPDADTASNLFSKVAHLKTPRR